MTNATENELRENSFPIRQRSRVYKNCIYKKEETVYNKGNMTNFLAVTVFVNSHSVMPISYIMDTRQHAQT